MKLIAKTTTIISVMAAALFAATSPASAATAAEVPSLAFVSGEAFGGGAQVTVEYSCYPGTAKLIYVGVRQGHYGAFGANRNITCDGTTRQHTLTAASTKNSPISGGDARIIAHLTNANMKISDDPGVGAVASFDGTYNLSEAPEFRF